jgi:hypothetical protein
MVLDADKRSKALALAASNNDAEALAALRAAGRLLNQAGPDWNDIAQEIEERKYEPIKLAQLNC